MEFRTVKPDVIKYEMRQVSGEDPLVHAQQHRPGGFGRFLSGLGRILGAIAAPLSIFFPPAMIGALGAYGVGTMGDMIQAKSYQKMAENQAKSQPQPMSFPGLELEGMGPVSMESVGDQGLTPIQKSILNTLYARNDMMMESAQKI